MSGDETRQKPEDASDSEEEDEPIADAIPEVDVDVTKLTPLSPEVISKQVRALNEQDWSNISDDPLGYNKSWCGPSIHPQAYNLDLYLPGTIGHVAHGKSTVVKAISGVQTVRFKNELVRNITIKLGYANAKVRANAPPLFVYSSSRRSTNAKTTHAHDQAATDHIAPIRKTIRPASDRDAITA